MPPDQPESTRFSPVVLVPTFNNASTLPEILDQIHQLGLAGIVVNDGSTDQTQEILTRFSTFKVLTHEVNLGKAAALRTGFSAAGSMDFTHVLTIDADGQHDAQDIPRLLEKSKESPDALILGTRQIKIDGYPRMSRLGRRVSNLLVRWESGLSVDDSQCGLRVYPLKLIDSTPCRASRYGYETEILTQAAWRGFLVVQVDIRCRYFEGAGRVSHFRPVIDSLRAVGMHTRLLLKSVQYWPKRWHPLAAWRQMRATPAARHAFAGGLAVGVFFACLPIYGLQGILSVVVAKLLRLNLVSALAGSQLSTPPLSAALIAASLIAGHFIVHRSWPSSADFQAAHASFRTLRTMRAVLLDWTIGGLFMGLVLAPLTYWIVRMVLARGSGQIKSQTDGASA